MQAISVPGHVPARTFAMTLAVSLAMILAVLAPATPAQATSVKKHAAGTAAAQDAKPAKTEKATTTDTAKKTKATAKKSKKTKKSAAKTKKSPSALSQAAAAAAGETGEDYTGLAPCYDYQARVKGRCEPQCIPYTRCRSGIMSCRLGHENGPLTWYACEVKRRNTSHTPEDGAVLILERDNGHGMPTGHAIFVEHAEPDGTGGYLLTVSHSNYDRHCHLETTVLARYDPEKKTLEMRSGAWQDWGRNLKVAGFIRK